MQCIWRSRSYHRIFFLNAHFHLILAGTWSIHMALVTVPSSINIHFWSEVFLQYFLFPSWRTEPASLLEINIKLVNFFMLRRGKHDFCVKYVFNKKQNIITAIEQFYCWERIFKSEAFSLTFPRYECVYVCSFWHAEQEFDLNYSPLSWVPMVPFNDFV